MQVVAAALLGVASTACTPADPVGRAATDIAGHLTVAVPPLIDAHSELTAVWSGEDPVWDAAFAAVLDDLAAVEADVLRTTSVPARSLLDGFPFVFELQAGGVTWCVSPADELPPRFESQPLACAELGFDDETSAQVTEELTQPALVRGRALLLAGYALLERLATSPDLAATIAEFVAGGPLEAVLVDGSNAVELRDGVLAVCVPVPEVAADTASRPEPGSCLSVPVADPALPPVAPLEGSLPRSPTR
jgi:hypothetical protein